ncbi:MAG: ATP-binding protein, partial [Nitrososphaerales archaeon]
AATVSEDLHRLSANLRPATLDRYGLAPAVEELVEGLRDQAGIEVEFQVQGLEERLAGDVETALYRIVQEACTNMARYAEARHARITLHRDAGQVLVSVEDDGRGFDVEETIGRGGLGLLGMRERAEMLGGAFTIDARPGQGTRLRAEAPAGGLSAKGSPASVARRQGVAPVDRALSSDVAELARAKALSDAMVEITAGTSRLTDQTELLSFVLGRAAEAVGCDYAVIVLLQGRRWIVTHGYGLPPAMIGQRLVPAAVPLALEIERTGGVLVVNDTRGNDQLAVAARESGVFSGTGVPLVIAGRVLGAAAFAHISDPVPFQPSEVAFLQQLSGVISLVLANSPLSGEDNPAG